MFEKMRECTVCGLTFLSGDICPGCGSNIHHQVVSEDQGESETETKIPGMDAFLETSSGVIPEVVEDEEEFQETPTSTLPFGMGGDSVNMKSTLPFGVGSHSLPFTATEQEFESATITKTEEKKNLEQVEVEPAEVEPAEVEPAEVEPAEVETQIIPPFDLEKIISVAEVKKEVPNPSVDEPIDERIEEEVVMHDFSNESLTTEVEVDLDNLVEYTSSEEIFNPANMEAAAEPELHPIKALAVEGLTDSELLENVQEGFLAMASSNWETAAKKFHNVATSGHGGAAALNNYGLALLQKAIETFESGDGVQKALVDGQFEAAIFALRQAAQSEGQRSEILYNLGIALHRAAWYDKALVVFDALLERDGPTAPVLNGKAVLLESKGDFESAKQLLNKAIYESPEDEIVRSNLSRLVPI
ncbi:MAG TPA: tetratricopeptide repeat protein [Candidatus Poseidoniaceae archaeon]|nr:tetratricopeptide repeat protein [Candidatus Poseidoniaceae archaeon]